MTGQSIGMPVKVILVALGVLLPTVFIAALVSIVAGVALGRLGASAATMFGTVGTLISIYGGAAA